MLDREDFVITRLDGGVRPLIIGATPLSPELVRMEGFQRLKI